MKRIISGKTYNTETATAIVEISNNYPSNDFNYCTECLYLTKKGQYFISGHGGPMTRYSVSYGNSTSGGEGLRLLSKEAALLFLQDNDCFYEIDNHFPDKVIEG